MRPLVFTVVLLVVTSIASSLYGDEVVFRNGDKLTGRILAADGGKMSIKTAVAGEVKVDLKDVKTFTTDQPIELQFPDGSSIKDRVKADQDGSVATEGGGDVKAQRVELASVRRINPPPVKWAGTVTVGGLITRGNSDTDNLNATLDMARRGEQDRLTFGAQYLFGRQHVPGDGDTTTTDNWYLLGKYDYFFTKKFYGYGALRVEKDRIADLDLRVTPGVGVGYQWVEKPDFNFSTEAGISWVYENYSNAESDDHFAARLAYHVDKKFNDKVALFHNLEFLPSVEDVSDFNVNADAGVRATLTERMFAEFKFEWRHDETPAPGASGDDLRYLLGVGWTF